MTRRAFVCCVLLLTAAACGLSREPTPMLAPALTPTPTLASTQTSILVPRLTPTPVPTMTRPGPYSGEVEGLVMIDEGRLIVGVNWLSKSRATYVVKGGNAEGVKKLLGETARVTGEIVDHSPWLKEIVVRAAEASSAPDSLSMRIGYIEELGPSIYMQGTHILVDHEGKRICLLGTVEGGPHLDKHMMSKVMVIGVLSKTVEGDAQIMCVELIQPVR